MTIVHQQKSPVRTQYVCHSVCVPLETVPGIVVLRDCYDAVIYNPVVGQLVDWRFTRVMGQYDTGTVAPITTNKR